MTNILLNCYSNQPGSIADLSLEPNNHAQEEDTNNRISILKLFEQDKCARAIFKYVPIGDLVRSERVCRKWQKAIVKYMQSIHNITFYDLRSRDLAQLSIENSHRTILIQAEAYPNSLAWKIINKWGDSIVKVFTVWLEEEYFELISLKCTYLSEIMFMGQQQYNFIRQWRKQLDLPLNTNNKFKKLRKMELKNINDLTDNEMSVIFKKVEIQELIISKIFFRGHCLKSIKSSTLKCLSLSHLPVYFDLSHLVAASKNLSTLKNLTLDYNPIEILMYAPLLINGMKELEHLSLCSYEDSSRCSGLGSEWNLELITTPFNECLGKHHNLKQVILRDNEAVNDGMLKALAKCRNLEYLDISYDDYAGDYRKWSVLGLAALCYRPPPAVTTLCLGYVQNIPSSDLLTCIRKIRRPVIMKLENMGHVKFTRQWLRNVYECSICRRYPLEVEAITRPAFDSPTKDNHPDLKIVLSTALHKKREPFSWQSLFQVS